MANNQHTLGGDLTINGGDISSVKTNVLIGGTGGATFAKLIYNGASSSLYVPSWNTYRHVHHKGSIQKFWGSTNQGTEVMEISQYNTNVTAPNGSFLSNSDKKLKDEIQDLDKNVCLDLLEHVNAKTY